MVNEPHVGMQVLYKSYGTPKGEFKPENRAAIVTAVAEDGTVSLCVMNPTGLFFNSGVKHGTEGGQWDYQWDYMA